MVSQDAETEQEVSRQDLIKGFEFEKDHYVLLDDDDFKQARIESSNTLTIGKFVDIATIDPIFFDTSYYVTPDGEAGQDVFVVLREAFRKSRAAALSRVVIAQRERAVAIMPSDKGLVCHTLHEPSDLWDAGPLFADIGDMKPEPDMVALATQLIDRQNGKFQPEDTQDRYEAKLRDVIDAKLKGEGITPEEPSEPDRGNVIDLMAALKASLGPEKSQRGSAAKASGGGSAKASGGSAKAPAAKKSPRKRA
jgi:DNA end-binding protein Ku